MLRLAPIPGAAGKDQWGLGAVHLAVPRAGTAYACARDSNPPTSGPHAPTWAEPGVYTEAVAKERLVHSMEHADVVIEEIVGRHLHNFIPSPELIPAP